MEKNIIQSIPLKLVSSIYKPGSELGLMETESLSDKRACEDYIDLYGPTNI